MQLQQHDDSLPHPHFSTLLGSPLTFSLREPESSDRGNSQDLLVIFTSATIGLYAEVGTGCFGCRLSKRLRCIMVWKDTPYGDLFIVRTAFGYGLIATKRRGRWTIANSEGKPFEGATKITQEAALDWLDRNADSLRRDLEDKEESSQPQPIKKSYQAELKATVSVVIWLDADSEEQARDIAAQWRPVDSGIHEVAAYYADCSSGENDRYVTPSEPTDLNWEIVATEVDDLTVEAATDDTD